MSIWRYFGCLALILIGSHIEQRGIYLALVGILFALDDIADAIRERRVR